MGNRYKAGEAVVERIRPLQKLIVSHFSLNLYYCKVETHRNRKELVYFERDLIAVGGVNNN